MLADVAGVRQGPQRPGGGRGHRPRGLRRPGDLRASSPTPRRPAMNRPPPYHVALGGCWPGHPRLASHRLALSPRRRRGPGRDAAAMVLGDRFGAACPASWPGPGGAELEPWATGCRATPYAGGYTTEHYGRPARVHALQIEINRALHLDETRSRHRRLRRAAGNLEAVTRGRRPADWAPTALHPRPVRQKGAEGAAVHWEETPGRAEASATSQSRYGARTNNNKKIPFHGFWGHRFFVVFQATMPPAVLVAAQRQGRAAPRARASEAMPGPAGGRAPARLQAPSRRPKIRPSLRNIAIIAHVDHGKPPWWISSLPSRGVPSQ
jgi:hypothetical protein